MTKSNYLYIMRKQNSEHFKVGISNNPLKRLKELQTGSSERLLLCKMFPTNDAKKYEKLIHRMLEQYKCNHRTEWFQMDKEVFDFVVDWIETKMKQN